MDRTPLLVGLLIGVLLDPVTATAQRSDKTSTRTGRGITSSKAARTPHTTSPKTATKRSSSTKTSKTTSPSTLIPDGTVRVLETMEVERVTHLEQERIQADLKKYKGWFEDSLADDLTSVTAEGLLENKAQVIARCL